MSDNTKKFYLTTPIYYVNARPHIGHAYTTIAADVIARRHRLLGDDTFFLTGTDEHGQKVERSAAAAGVSPQQFADQVSASFRSLWDRMGITYDDYIRTTDPRHKSAVQKLFATLQQRGFIELNSYTGQYSVGEEMFVEGPPGTIGPDGKPTETVTEENYFFKLSAFQRSLIDLIESRQLNIQPEVRRNEVLSFLRGNVIAAAIADPYGVSTSRDPETSREVALPADPRADGRIDLSAQGVPYAVGALKDLSISRSSFKWGIPVPGDEKHVIYVWLDALANYMTAIGYGSDDPAEQAKFEKYWPAKLHLVGKEIIRFHCVYWPAFLMAAGLQLPKAITAHGWLLFEDSKMSKSRGNIVRTETILDAFGTLCPPSPGLAQNTVILSEAHSAQSKDPEGLGTGTAAQTISPQNSIPATKREQDLFAADVLRYFLLREIPFGQDGSFSFDALVQRYNSDLANGYGNLVSRTLAMIHKYRLGLVPKLESDTHEALFPPFKDIEITWEYLGFLMGRENAGEAARTKENDARFQFFLISIWDAIATCDTAITAFAPWKVFKNDSESKELDEILYRSAESIRIITALLYSVMPYATAKVWAQLGLGDIEEAARKGELKTLKWGDLKPGTKLGDLAPIFPRAPKELIQIMTDMENPAPPTSSKLVDEKTTHTTPAPEDPTHPGAAPRTSTLSEPNPGATVAGSAALTTERPTTPPHTEAAASGIFAAAASTTPDTPQIAIDDFVKVDLRVAKIIVAERIPKADKLLRLEVDLGYEKRQVLAGIAEWYTPEELLGKKIVIIANLAPRKMRGLESHGMLLAASHGENGKPVLATFSEDIELGSRLK
jgi:methionyl-tRNA synthetase